MKQRNIGLLLPAVLCALVLSACVEPLAAPSPAPTAEPAPAALTVEDLAAVLTGLAPSEGTITWFDEQGEQGSYPAGSAICGEDYTHRLREFQWEALQPYPAWEAEEVYRRIKYTAPGVTLTAFSSLGNDTLALRAVTGDGEGWFTLPSIEDSDPQLQDGQYAWMLYGEVFQPWLEEAESAARYGGDGDGEPLTAEELRWFRDYTASTRSRYHPEWGGWSVGATPVSCFFTCRYDDPRDMDAGEFLYYCPGDGHLEPGNEADEAEFRLVQAHPQMHFWGDGQEHSLDHLPVPCHRYSRPYVNEILTRYAGLTVEEMHTDWLEELLYVPETDCFYGFASDFGPGTFVPRYGEKSGDTVKLWESMDSADVLTLRQAGEGWHILSHQAAE